MESFGTVDGPGVRLVLFLQGCPMRCLYCHNPDTWNMDGGTPVTVEEVLALYEKNKDFYQKGGITVTGGEPLVQMDFVTELFEAAAQKGIHTCVDTSGITFHAHSPKVRGQFDRLTAVTSLVMLDIKHMDPESHEKLTSRQQAPVLDFARYLDERAVPVWIRHVVVPGITDGKRELYQLGRFIGTLHNVEALDVLPYHDMGKAKYHNLGIPYPLEKVKPLGKEEALAARKMIVQGIREEKEARLKGYVRA